MFWPPEFAEQTVRKVPTSLIGWIQVLSWSGTHLGTDGLIDEAALQFAEQG